MRRNLWTRAVLLAAVGAVAARAGPCAAASTDAYRAALLAPATKPDARDEAARRLAVGGTPADIAALHDALTAGGPLAASAAARAIAGTVDPDRSLLGPLIALLGPNRLVAESAVTALAGYAASPSADPALNALRAFADDPNIPPLARGPAVRAVGAFVSKRAAAYLVDEVGTSNPSLQQAAADALAEMSGDADRGTNAAAWRAWWAGHAGQSEADWRAYLLGVRARDAGPARVRQAQLAVEAAQLLHDDYYRLPDGAKPAVLLSYLDARSAPIRAAGAMLVVEQLGTAAVPNAVLQRVRDLVADDDAAVRAAAIGVLNTAVDQQAGPAMVAQLRRERDWHLRKQLAQALGKLQDLDAAGALLELLHDPQPPVATAAAKALGSVGPQLKRQRPALAANAGAGLRAVITAPPTAGGGDDLRAACVAALAALGDPQAFEALRGILNAQPPESRDVRVAALNGFGVLGDRNADEIVAGALSDPDRQVRLAAARAMLTVGRVAEADQLGALLNPQEDPDVRDAAWQALAHLLDGGSVDLLQNWVGRFPDDPARRLVVRQDYGRALGAAGQSADAAANDQETAQTLMELKRPADAIGYLQAAMNYYQRAQPPGEDTMTNLVGQMLDAQLAANQYAAATDLAARQIRVDHEYQRLAGPKFCDEADRLKSKGDGADAGSLIDAALSMNPPLEPRYSDQLKLIRDRPQQTP